MLARRPARPAIFGQNPNGPTRQVVAYSFVVAEIDLAGEWIGHYPGHFDEVIRIEQRGEHLEAVKITGDEYVPAGAVTWRANLRTLEGEGQIAEMEFRHPRFVRGRLLVVNPEWGTLDHTPHSLELAWTRLQGAGRRLR